VFEINEAIDCWAGSAITDKIRCEIDVDADEVPGEHCDVLGLVFVELSWMPPNIRFVSATIYSYKESSYEMDLA
jgi:hypothetical protein